MISDHRRLLLQGGSVLTAGIQRRRSLSSLLPLGERCPAGADEGPGDASVGLRKPLIWPSATFSQWEKECMRRPVRDSPGNHATDGTVAPGGCSSRSPTRSPGGRPPAPRDYSARRVAVPSGPTSPVACRPA